MGYTQGKNSYVAIFTLFIQVGQLQATFPQDHVHIKHCDHRRDVSGGEQRNLVSEPLQDDGLRDQEVGHQHQRHQSADRGSIDFFRHELNFENDFFFKFRLSLPCVSVLQRAGHATMFGLDRPRIRLPLFHK